MADIKQARVFIQVARRDFTALGGMHDATIFADEIVGFHVQQAVEKCLKAWLCVKGVTFPFTHDLNRLIVMLRDSGEDVTALWWADEFTLFAQQARYEHGHLQEDAPLDRKDILGRVEKLLVSVEEVGLSAA
jgi:HEPN domain-containing protein